MPVDIPRRQALLLAALLVALGVVVIYQFSGSGRSASPVVQASGATARRADARGTLQPVPAVKLADLTAARPEPSHGGRDLFREKPAAPPPPPPRPVQAAAPPPDPNAPPPPPPPPPPITLKFIGVVQQPKGSAIAVFSDGRDVFYGREGDVIEGRYKIIRIGVESAELSYVDGRGRQRIALTQ